MDIEEFTTKQLKDELLARGYKDLNIYDTGSIVEIVCNKYNVDTDVVFERNRRNDVCFVRDICFYIFHKRLGMGSVKSGEVFGRDHSTVLHSCKKINKELLVNDSLSMFIDKVVLHIKKK